MRLLLAGFSLAMTTLHQYIQPYNTFPLLRLQLVASEPGIGGAELIGDQFQQILLGVDGLLGLYVLQKVCEGHVSNVWGSGSGSKGGSNVFGFEMTGEWCEVPFEMFDVRIQGDGGIGNDFMVVYPSGAPLGNLGFHDACFEHNLLT